MASIEIPATSISVLAFLLSYLTLAGATTFASQGKASSILVVGKVFCDTCLGDRLSENGYVISGASIAVECELNRKTMTISFLRKTDENGEFRVELPSDIFQSTDQLNNCWARPRNSPYDSCNIPRISAPSKLSLLSASNGVMTYSAGSFSYRHETVPPSCYSEDLLSMIHGRAMAEDVDQSSKAGQQMPTIPSLPQFPPATLPGVAPLPKFTIPPLPSVPPLPKTPPLPSTPPLPKMSPLPSAPPLPKISPLPQFSVPPLPKMSPLPAAPPLPKTSPLPGGPPLPITSPLPGGPPLPKISPLPHFSVPPLPKMSALPSAPLLKISPLPQLSAPPLPKTSPLPSAPPLPKTPPLPQLSFPPFPKPTIPGSPPIPQIPNFQFPPIPFLTPPPPSH